MCPRAFHVAFLLTLLAGPLTAQQAPTSGDSTSLTIYDSNFSVVRTAIELGLQPGVNDVATTKVTTQLEPDSVVLTNQAGPGTFKILEQSYVSGIDTQERLKPTVKWQIESEKAQNLHAEFAYITGGLSWQAAYNAIVPDAAADVTGDQRGDILGWDHNQQPVRRGLSRRAYQADGRRWRQAPGSGFQNSETDYERGLREQHGITGDADRSEGL